MINDMYGAKPLESFFPSLAAVPSVQTALREEFGKDASTIIAKMNASEPLSDKELGARDSLHDFVHNNSFGVDSFEGWSSACDDTFPINIMKFASVFWIEAPEFDDIGYFDSLEEAKDVAEAAYEPLISEASEHKAIQKLEDMPLADRIAAIADDVNSHRDEYRLIDSHELAYILRIMDAYRPGGDWNFVRYIQRTSIEDIFSSCEKDAFLELLASNVPPEKYEELAKKYEEINWKRIRSFLNESEKETIERAYMEKRDKAYDSRCVAYYTIREPHLRKLTFQASVEDDGGCIDLKTPYDARDGAFTDLSDCLIVQETGYEKKIKMPRIEPP